MKQFFNRLIPFIFLGIAIVAFAFGIMLLAYLFIFGAIAGLVLFFISWLRDKFFPAKTPIKMEAKSAKKSGRVIDSTDWKKM